MHKNIERYDWMFVTMVFLSYFTKNGKNAISPDQSFSFQRILAQKYLDFHYSLKPRWRLVRGYLMASDTPCPVIDTSVPLPGFSSAPPMTPLSPRRAPPPVIKASEDPLALFDAVMERLDSKKSSRGLSSQDNLRSRTRDYHEGYNRGRGYSSRRHSPQRDFRSRRSPSPVKGGDYKRRRHNIPLETDQERRDRERRDRREKERRHRERSGPTYRGYWEDAKINIVFNRSLRAMSLSLLLLFTFYPFWVHSYWFIILKCLKRLKY